jgi:hypothetical protein
MRLSIAAASFVISAAFLTGCSNPPQGSTTLPVSGSADAMGRSVGAPRTMPKYHSALQLLQLQAEGKLPGPNSRKDMEREFKYLRNHPRPTIKLRANGTGVGLWTSLSQYSYLLGENKKGKNTVAAIDTASNSCIFPVAIKVDHSQDIWTNCEDNGQTGLSAEQEYSKSGSFIGSYNVACPVSGSESCSSTYAYGYDGAANASNVFAALTFFKFSICNPSCNQIYGPGFEYWPAGQPSATPTLIALPYNNPFQFVDYMDLDSNGNIWFDYEGCQMYYPYDCGNGLAEVQTPTTNPTVVVILPPDVYIESGGVYVSNGGNTLNVIDQSTQLVYQYHLPLSPGGTPFNTLGPTAFGLGSPVSGGFNSADTKMAIGDDNAFLDIGTVSQNKWAVVKAPLFSDSLQGAAYTSSDK